MMTIMAEINMLDGETKFQCLSIYYYYY